MKVRVHDANSNEVTHESEIEELFDPADDEVDEARAAIEKHGYYVVGGGAAPMYWITRIEENPE